ncbi:MAG TPA: amidohydrolase family protein [Nevskia sp.]|nr:amidohydrolase family protein [Nevskia sp.]
MKNILLPLLGMAALLPGAALAETIAITNAEIHTLGRAGVITHGTLVIRDHRIEAVGENLAPPPGARIIDAAGKPVTPGLFDAYTSLGLKEIDGVSESVDTGARKSRLSAALDAADAFNPRSTLIPVSRVEGLTRAATAPQAEGDSLFAGQGAVVSLGSLSNWLVKPKAAMYADLGESGAKIAGGSRSATWATLREYLEEVRRAGTPRLNPDHPSALGLLDVEALKPVLAGEEPLVVYVNRASDILSALKFAEDNNLRLVVRGGAEAWLVAPQLAAQRVPVILDPRLDLPQRFESLAARADAAALLNKAGVMLAISLDDDFDTHNARNLRQLAGNAVTHGLDREAALAAITLNPARIYGVDSTLGSLEPGKIADVVVWDGDPLETTSFPRTVLIEGNEVPPRSRQTELRDRYMEKLKLGPYAKK